MAMTYEQSDTLMRDAAFRGRVKVAGMKFSDYIFLEAATTPGHSGRYRWAQNFIQQPDMQAAQIQPMVVMDSAVQEAGVDEEGKALITDEALQTTVETVVGKIV